MISNSYPQLEVRDDVESRSLNYAFSYGVILAHQWHQFHSHTHNLSSELRTSDNHDFENGVGCYLLANMTHSQWLLFVEQFDVCDLL